MDAREALVAEFQADDDWHTEHLCLNCDAEKLVPDLLGAVADAGYVLVNVEGLAAALYESPYTLDGLEWYASPRQMAEAIVATLRAK